MDVSTTHVAIALVVLAMTFFAYGFLFPTPHLPRGPLASVASDPSPAALARPITPEPEYHSFAPSTAFTIRVHPHPHAFHPYLLPDATALQLGVFGQRARLESDDDARLRVEQNISRASDLSALSETKQENPADVGQNAWLEIDLAVFKKNLETLHEHLSNGGVPIPTICPVLKSDAYGHGVSGLMPILMDFGIRCIAITNNQEARDIRQAGYTHRIMRVRIATTNEIMAARPLNVEEIIGNVQHAKLVSEAILESDDGQAIPEASWLKFHLGLNSGGMSRESCLDLRSHDGRADAQTIHGLEGMRLVGIMTHYANQTVLEVEAALRRFNDEAKWMLENAEPPLDRKAVELHTAASYATLAVPASRLDLVRPGSLLYGKVAEFSDFKRVMKFKTVVASVSHYPANGEVQSVGYGGLFKFTRESWFANLPVGYSDGYPRVNPPGGTTEVIINNERFTTIGVESMNALMVDVTDVMKNNTSSVKVGDAVILFGSWNDEEGSAEITQAEMQTWTGRVLSELYCSWGHANHKFTINGPGPAWMGTIRHHPKGSLAIAVVFTLAISHWLIPAWFWVRAHQD